MKIYAILSLNLFLLACFEVVPPLACANEPLSPPDAMKPRTHVVELKEEAILRMGDTIQLKGTDFSAKLSGFGEPGCAMPGQSCASAVASTPTAEFQYRQGDFNCDSVSSAPIGVAKVKAKPIDRNCVLKLKYIAKANDVMDRSKVVVRLIERKKK